MLKKIFHTIPALLALPLQSVLATPVSLAALPGSGTKTRNMVASAWYAGWHADQGFPLSHISWDKYTSLVYSFASTTSDVTQLSLAGSDGDLLPQFVSEVHSHNIQAYIAIGGWGGSQFFSPAVATAKNRTAFVKTVTEFATKYKLDGVNFDWEYPGSQGIGCNAVSPKDTANFLLFLQALRADPTGAKLTITAATSIAPFHDVSGSPLTNITAFASVLDYIQIMNYDVWGSWSTRVGPNAPLNDTCAPPADQVGSAVSAVAAWTKAGMPKDKIVLGVAAYGHSFSVKPSDAFVDGTSSKGLAAYPPFDASKQPLGDSWDNTGGLNQCGVYQAAGGVFNFWGLIAGGFLTSNGKPAKGIDYRFDECTKTPYVYNATSQVMVSFDNADSFAAKGKFIREMGLRGFAIWEAGGDHNDMLINSIRSEL